MYREWVVVCVKGAGKANHSHSAPHGYLPPNKDRTRAFPITCCWISLPCCTGTRRPRDRQASSGSDPSGWRRLRELFLPKLIYSVTLMALRLGKCSRVSIHYRFRPVYHQLCTINCSSPWPIHPGRGISELLKLGVADTLVDYRQPGSPGTRTDMEVSMATIISYAPHHCCPEPKWHPTSSKNFNRMNADWPPLRYEHSDMSTLRTGSLVSASSKWLDRSHKFIFRLHKGSPLASGFRVRLEAMWFKGVFDWDPLPAEQYGEWIPRAERHGGGEMRVVILALQVTACGHVLKSKRLFKYVSHF